MSLRPLSPSPVGRGGTAGWPRSLGLVALLLAGCAHRDRIVVGSKNFTESDLLGEIVAQQIARRTGLPVERRFHLGGTFVCHQAITSGQIDLYVERSEEHTSELQSRLHLVCRLLLEKK